MSTMKHPNIVQLLGVVKEPSLMIVQELVSNGSLESKGNGESGNGEVGRSGGGGWRDLGT